MREVTVNIGNQLVRSRTNLNISKIQLENIQVNDNVFYRKRCHRFSVGLQEMFFN